MARLNIGDLVTFSYRGKNSHDTFPQVLVLHQGWQNPLRDKRPYVHGLNFNYLSDDEINYIRVVLNPDFAVKYADELKRKNAALGAEMERIAATLPSHETKYSHPMANYYSSLDIKSPHDFYLRFVKKFIQPRGYDPYRRYIPENIMNVRVMRDRRYMTGQTLFGAFKAYVKDFMFKSRPDEEKK